GTSIPRATWTPATSVFRSGRGRASPTPRFRADEVHLRALAHRVGQLPRVPVGEADAAVRRRLAHQAWVRGAVDAEGRLAQGDPDDTHRIVRPGLDVELADLAVAECQP